MDKIFHSCQTWFYLDREGCERGPLRSEEMLDWFCNDVHFPTDLLVRRSTKENFTRLSSLVQDIVVKPSDSLYGEVRAQKMGEANTLEISEKQNKEEYVELETKEEFIKSELKESVKRTEVKDECRTTELKEEQIKPKIKVRNIKELIKPEIKEELEAKSLGMHYTETEMEYKEPEINKECIKTEVKDIFFKNEIKDKPEIEKEHLKHEIKNEHINPEAKQEFTKRKMKEEAKSEGIHGTETEKVCIEPNNGKVCSKTKLKNEYIKGETKKEEINFEFNESLTREIKKEGRNKLKLKVEVEPKQEAPTKSRDYRKNDQDVRHAHEDCRKGFHSENEKYMSCQNKMSKILFIDKVKDNFYANRNLNKVNNYHKSQNSQMNSEKSKTRNAGLEFRGTNKKLKIDWQIEEHMDLYGMKERRQKEDFSSDLYGMEERRKRVDTYEMEERWTKEDLCSDLYEKEERWKKEDLRDKLILKVSDRVRDRRLRSEREGLPTGSNHNVDPLSQIKAGFGCKSQDSLKDMHVPKGIPLKTKGKQNPNVIPLGSRRSLACPKGVNMKTMLPAPTKGKVPQHKQTMKNREKGVQVTKVSKVIPVEQKKKSNREEETLAMLARFKNKLSSLPDSDDKSEKESKGKQDGDDISGDNWMKNRLKFKKNDPVLDKYANTKNDDWFNIYDPRNSLNKRRLAKAKELLKKKAKKNNKSKKDICRIVQYR